MSKETKYVVRLTDGGTPDPPATGGRTARGPGQGATGEDAAEGRCRWPRLG